MSRSTSPNSSTATTPRSSPAVIIQSFSSACSRSTCSGLLAVYQDTATPLALRTRQEITALFDGWTIVPAADGHEAAIVPVAHWRWTDELAKRISSRNARSQQWQALLGNRTKRTRSGEFLVQGVRPITLAADYGWAIHALLYDASRPLSRWAEDLLRRIRADKVAMAPGLLAELGEKTEGAPEVVAVVEMPPDELTRIKVRDDFLGVVFDRPTSPGNIGAVIRSADAFGAGGLIVTGHAADVYDT